MALIEQILQPLCRKALRLFMAVGLTVLNTLSKGTESG
jgi:hypothetical protein